MEIRMTKSHIVKVFERWVKDYRENPEDYPNDLLLVKTKTVRQEAGDAAEHFLRLLSDIQARSTRRTG